MIQEISNFMEAMPPLLKGMGLKPKEGIHVLLGLEKKDDTVVMDRDSVRRVCCTKDATDEDYPFLQRCALLAQIAWCVNTNKCYDKAKGIHTCSPYCVAFKKESLPGGAKYDKDKVKIYDRVNPYFENALALLPAEEEQEKVRVFRNFLNSRDRMEAVLGVFRDQLDGLKDKEYVIFYLDVPEEDYRKAAEVYLKERLFNTNNYNKTVGGEVFGTCDFLNGFSAKKPFLMHQSASFDIAGRVSRQMARNLFEFQEIMGRNILPRPLPIFIYKEELKKAAFTLFAGAAGEGKRITYREVMKELYDKCGDGLDNDLGNYYLLYYDRGTLKDFDFVPKFSYKLTDGEKEYWEIRDYFGTKGAMKLRNVFDLETCVLQVIFDNALVVRTKTGDFMYKYFDEIDSAYCKSAATYLLLMKYRGAFYDYIYKSRQQAVTRRMFEDILLTGILDDIRVDEYKERKHTRGWAIRQKLNIWFSLAEYFEINAKNEHNMEYQLTESRIFIDKLVNGKAVIENGDQYAFAAGQLIAYIFLRSKTADRSHRYMTPFMQQVNMGNLNLKITDFVVKYNHLHLSAKSEEVAAQVMEYGYKNRETDMNSLSPMLMAGALSPNLLFSEQDLEEDSEEVVTE